MGKFTKIVNKACLSEIFDFTIDEVTELLVYVGLIDSSCSCKKMQLEKYIFLHGDDEEVYRQEEREFIEKIGEIYIYNEFYKKVIHGIMPCRVIAAEIESLEPLKECIFFMKEINKAIGGYTIFFIKANEEFYIGMRAFNNDAQKDCIVSNPIVTCEDMEKIWNKLMFVSESEEFIDYYNTMVMAIEFEDEDYENYDMQIVRKHGIQYSYLQMLSDIEKMFRASASRAKSGYYDSFETIKNQDFSEYLKDIYSELDFIKSYKPNTMEMLFEAEEVNRLVSRTEEENDTFLANYKNENEEDKDISNAREYLEDPELVIKMLKQKRRI